MRLIFALVCVFVLISSCFETSLGAKPAKRGRGGAGMGMADGNELAPICPSNKVPVQKIGKRVQSNGCSKPAFLAIDGEEDFTTCCDYHDACYATCGIQKEFCESEFERCMKRLCSDHFSANSRCHSAASTYAMGTTAFGGGGFETSQRDYCECVDPDRVPGHYINAVEQFYSQFTGGDSAGGEKDAKAIVTGTKYGKNHGTEENPLYKDLPKLYYNLVKKYDSAAIEHIEGRVQNKNPPRLKDKAKKEKAGSEF